jgi:long-chain acyl-CoA synthetase
LPDLAAFLARTRPEAVAFIAGGEESTFAGVDRRSRQVAAGLCAEGTQPGERVAYLGRNSADYFEILFGVARIGAVFMPLNWRLSEAELAYILADAQVRTIFGEADQLARLEAHGVRLERKHVIDVARPEASSYAAWRASREPESATGDGAHPEDAVMQFYTSGTTGRPKGAMISHRNILCMRTEMPVEAQLPFYRWDEGDSSILSLPLFHIGTAMWALIGYHHGGMHVIQPEFDAAATIEAIQRHRITRLCLVPAALQMVIQHPDAEAADFSSVRYTFYGASPMPLPLLREAMQRLGGEFVQVYGMTEATGSVVALPPEDHDPDGGPKATSVGKAMPGVELAILDAEGRPLADGVIGEVAIRSPMVMIGYFRQPEATAETIINGGWLRTGDAGYLVDGYLYIHDRIKEMIITGGENVYPAEVEAAVREHPAVEDVAVIGVPDQRWGEAVKAVVVLRQGQTATGEEIIAAARTRIAGFKLPKTVEFVSSLPRNPSGKLLRREVREPYWRGFEKRVN